MRMFHIITIVFTLLVQSTFGQRSLSEGTLVYDILVETNNKEPKMADAFDGATSTIYLKGSNSRVDMVSMLGTERTFHDAQTGAATILKEYSGQKLMITLKSENWIEKTQLVSNIRFQDQPETKVLSGYNCNKATGQLNDGTAIVVFFTKELIPTNREYDPMFKSLPGLPLQYELNRGNTKFVYTANRIDFTPVPASMFEIPPGYRMMTYEESKSRKPTR